MAILNNSNAISAGGYDINNSLRFRSSATAYLTRTQGNGSATSFTASMWVKRGQLTTSQHLLNSGSVGTTEGYFRFNGSDALEFQDGTNLAPLTTTAVFRDPSAWYHIVLSVNTANATAADRVIVYVNGTRQTTTGTHNGSNLLSWNKTGEILAIGRFTRNTTNYFDGYMTEVNFIDGQALTPSSFGATNADTGVWQPAKYTGTYGTNGFYLKFSDIATTSGSNAGLGKDFSGNTNYWTTNNISVTAGTTYDAMTDSPTLTSATVANYCVLNPLKNGGMTLSEGNLTAVYVPASWVSSAGTIAVSSGKWYFEDSMGGISTSAYTMLGIRLADVPLTTYLADDANGWGILANSVNISTYTNAVATNLIAFSSTTSTIYQVAIDVDAGKLWLGYNNNWVGGGSPSAGTSPTYTLTANRLIHPVVSSYGNTSYVNFGQRPFAYTPPTGFNRLNTFNLPTPTILQGNRFMDATTYTGNGSTQVIVNQAQFKPDLVWNKGRSNVVDHCLTDSNRGANKQLVSNTTGAELTYTNQVTGFNSNGFSLGADNLGYSNYSAVTYVAWQWQAGQGSTSSNTSGSITSTVSVNTTAGFSIVTYTGTGANATVGHGLGVAPKMVIVKKRSATGSWAVYHIGLTSAAYQVWLDLTSAQLSRPTTWNSTAPTSTVFSIGTDTDVNVNAATFVAYCWSEIAGFSKFGSYTGNGSADGPFIFTNLLPKFILIKRTDTTGNWIIWDTVRNTYNVLGEELYPNLSNAAASSTDLDILSNGFKLRSTNAAFNASGGTYIYACWASNPFKNSNGF